MPSNQKNSDEFCENDSIQCYLIRTVVIILEGSQKKLEFSAKSINNNHCEKNLSDIEFKSKTLKLRVCIIQTEKKSVLM